MSPNSRKKDEIGNLSHEILASERVIKSLQDLDFKLEKREFSFHELNVRLKIDIIFRRGKKSYAVEVKSSRKMQLVLMHLLPRAILRLRAASRIKGFLPILAIAVPILEPREIQRMARYMDFYAPEVGWLLLDEEGRGVFKDRENDQYALLNEGQIEWIKGESANDLKFFRDLQISLFDRIAVHDEPNSEVSRGSSSFSSSSSASLSVFHSSSSSSSSSSRMQLSFSDLDQWLIKAFLMSPLDVASDYWGGPKGYAENAYQLSKLADVSQAPANLWAQAMESNGYLKRVGRRGMIILRPKAILEEWVGRYRFSDNRIYPYRSMFPVSDSDAYFDELLKDIKKNKKKVGSLAIAAHQACKLHRIKHSSARSIHIYFLGNVQRIADILKVVPSEDERKADLFLVEPKYPRSVFGGVLQKKGIPVCDILQCYLDLFHLADRGREQANFIYEDILSRIIRLRQGAEN
jgi:hypothetical protein